MFVLFAELDGTTHQRELPRDMLQPTLRMPIYPRLCAVLSEGEPPMGQRVTVREALYKLIGVSGDIAFYDRVCDLREFE